jgi:hypothetical protein
MPTVGHMLTKVVPWIAGITSTGLAIYWISTIIRYWDTDSWTLTSGKVVDYDRPFLYDPHSPRHVLYPNPLQLRG